MWRAHRGGPTQPGAITSVPSRRGSRWPPETSRSCTAVIPLPLPGAYDVLPRQRYAGTEGGTIARRAGIGTPSKGLVDRYGSPVCPGRRHFRTKCSAGWFAWSSRERAGRRPRTAASDKPEPFTGGRQSMDGIDCGLVRKEVAIPESHPYTAMSQAARRRSARALISPAPGRSPLPSWRRRRTPPTFGLPSRPGLSDGGLAV